MKNIAFKSFVFIPLLFFVDYLIMIIIGCTSSLFSFADNFYNGTFCTIGKSVLALSLIGYILIIAPDLKSLVKKLKINWLVIRVKLPRPSFGIIKGMPINKEFYIVNLTY